MKKIKLSIVLLNYKTFEITDSCIDSIKKSKPKINYEIIVVDNGSFDGSIEKLSQKYKDIVFIQNKKNLGFARGNNAAMGYVRGEYVLFLNTDTLVEKGTLEGCVTYLDKYEDVAAITCKQVLPDGSIDKDSRRSFPTPWVAFTHFFGLDRVFPRSKIFARYWCGYLDPDKTYEIEVAQGAFIMTRKIILDKIGWFDKDYFLDGEDIDLSWKIRELGKKIIYYPKVKIVHFKGYTKGKNKYFKKDKKRERKSYVLAGANSMEIFYRKRMWNKYPLILNYIVLLGIKFIKINRLVKLYLS